MEQVSRKRIVKRRAGDTSKTSSIASEGWLSIAKAFEAQVRRTPDAVAVGYQGVFLTYRELNCRANRLAHYLMSLGVGPETRVGLCLERSLELVVSLLGILKAGGAYVPLDPSYPAPRLEYMLADSGARILLTEKRIQHLLPDAGLQMICLDQAKSIDRHRRSNPAINVAGENLAYVMYTSGSTGKPKGVLIEQHSVVSLVKNNNYARLGPEEVLLQLAPISFDAATFELWGALLNGARLVIAPAGTLSPAEVGTIVREEKITTLWLTAGLFHIMVDENTLDLKEIRQLLAGGDVLFPGHVRKAAGALRAGAVINGYGPTENTTFTCTYAVRAPEKLHNSVPIGKPLTNVRAYLLDQNIERVKTGEVGELYAGGEGTARGYQNHPDWTAEKFVPDPFSNVPGARIYRTGDLARQTPDGDFEFIGRVDGQVKIRGHRIEPGEIEAALSECAGVRAAAVTVVQDKTGIKRLVGYIVPASGHSLSSNELRGQLAGRLPEYMIPVQFVLLDELPLTHMGKLDRGALPQPQITANGSALLSRTEELLAVICSRVIGLEQVPLNATFMELGGSSLNATQAVSQVRDAFSLDLSLRELLGGKTLRDIARELENRSAGFSEKRAEFRRWPRNNGLLPASYSQERVWFVHRMAPATLAYHFTAKVTFQGDLNAAALGKALNAVVERHEIYRTTLTPIDGVLFQKIHAPWRVELEAVDASTQPGKLEQVVAEESQRPFDLTQLPLVRWKLVRVEPQKHVLVAVEHHILHDGWSFHVFLKELTELYRSQVENCAACVNPSPLQFSDFAQWQREWMESQEAREQLAYWKNKLEGAPPLLLLPYKGPRPSVQTYNGAIPRIEISDSLNNELAAQCRNSQSTLFMLFAAAFQILLFRYSGQKDFCIGTGIANRRWSETRDLIGMLVNNIALRFQMSGDPTITEVLEQVRRTTLEAYAHQDVPFDKVVQAADPVRDLRYNPIFQVLLSFHDSPIEGAALPGLSLELEVGLSNASAKFDMNIIVIPARQSSAANYGSKTKILWEYNSDLFHPEMIEQMIRHYVTLLEEIARDPRQKASDIEMLTPAERRQVLMEWNRTERIFPREEPVHGLFAEQARKTPHAIAVKYGDRQLTYTELDRNANEWAAHLAQIGVRTESRVGICMGAGVEMITAMLAILKAGGAYVPLDPAYPSERLLFMIQDAKIGVVVTQEPLLTRLQESRATLVCTDGTKEWVSRSHGIGDGLKRITGENLAYVMYTSGSSGIPKGTQIEHRNVVRLVRNTDYLRLSEHDRIAQAATASFDAATFEIWGALLNGGCVVGIDKETALNPERLEQVLDDERITIMFLTTALFNQVAHERSSAFARLKCLLFGGEAVDPRSAYKALKEGHPEQLLHVYGPTEGTTFSTWFEVSEVREDAETIPIGTPIANAQAYVLDEWQRPVPLEVAGELYVGGDGLGRGYLNRAALTAEKFVPDSFSTLPGARLYRTGDLVRRLRDGNLEFLGRLDDQVKIRGFRIEPGEIESSVRSYSAVQEAVVVTLNDSRGDKQLVAYVVLQPGANQEEDLQRYLRKKLPDYMVPWIVRLESLPLTVNGKVDRKRLTAPKWNVGNESPQMERPYSQTEELLAGIWKAVLHVSRVNIHASFFKLGGHSLLLMQVLSRIRGLFGIEMPVRDAFQFPGLADMAARIDELMRKKDGGHLPPLLAGRRGHSFPLSFAQQRLWFIQQFDPGSSVYHIPIALRLYGPLDMKALERSLFEITSRHEVLRTTFGMESGVVAQVIHPVRHPQLTVCDLQGIPPDTREISVKRIVQDYARMPFDLVCGPLLRALLLRLDEEEHVLVLCMHHIVSDGWSLEILKRELNAMYAAYSQGRDPSLSELPIQYLDYAIWQREWLQGKVLEQQLCYWKQQLAGIPDLLELPMARPRSPVQSYQGAFHHFQISPEIAARFHEMSQSNSVTLFMTLLTAFYVLLYRLTGQPDLVLGTPIAGRNLSEIEGLIGFFVNTLVLRADLSGRPNFEELLKRVREAALGAFSNSDMPFEKLVEALQPERKMSRTALFQMTFALQNIQPTQWVFSGLQTEEEPIEWLDVKFDFSMSLTEGKHGLAGYVGYRTDIYESGTIERIVCYFQQVLRQFSENPQLAITAFDLLTVEERSQILYEFNATDQEYSRSETLLDLFEDEPLCQLETPAVLYGGAQLTYRDLHRKADHVARQLQMQGVSSEGIVGVCLERSLEIVIAILGILKAGGAYMPMAPDHPRKRLEQMAGHRGVKLVVTSADIEEKIGRLATEQVRIEDLLSAEFKGGPAQSRIHGEHPAYVIFTSGSTGEPKGVVVTHSAICNHMAWMQHEFPLAQGDRVLQKTSFNFDASVWEFLAPILAGATLVMAEPGGQRDGEYLVQCVQLERITILQLVPSQLRMLLQQKGFRQCHSLRRVYCGGEALEQELVREFRLALPETRLYNLYGPAEAAIDSTWSECDTKQEGGTSWIGKPVANAQVYVLDQELMPVPIGMPGELFIAGAGLARGYLNRPDLTAERFISNPFSRKEGERLYKTGDRCRFRADGQLEFLGRMDNQVKIRGQRIELDEIRAILAEHTTVRQCIVVAREKQPGDKQLIAYVAGWPDGELNLKGLRQYLKERLPEYMVPSIVQIDSVPLTFNGKIDFNRLPSPGIESENNERGIQTQTQELLSGIWAEVLGIANISVHDNFFSLGGHSLAAVRVIARIREIFGIDIPVRCVFECPELAILAETIDRSSSSGASLTNPPLRPMARTSALPLSFAQLRLWFLQQFELSSPAYNLPFVLHLQGDLKPDVLEKSISEIITRHESLRTTFGNDPASPEQVIHPAAPVFLPIVDLQGLDHDSRQRETERRILTQSQAAFNLSDTPPLRVELVQLNPDEYLLLVTMHHIISDGWSLAIFVHELAALYEDFVKGQKPSLPEITVQYADYAAWQRECQQAEGLHEQMRYWRKQLKALPEVLTLPLASQRPAVSSHHGTRHRFEISQELLLDLKQECRQEGVTLFMVLLAAFQILLHRYCNSDDIPVGTPHAGRNHPAVEGLIGFFVNTLVLRTDLSKNPSLSELFHRVREVALGAYASQVPFEKLVEELRPERDMSRTPLFQVMFTLQNQPEPKCVLPGIKLAMEEVNLQDVKFDLSVSLRENGSGVTGAIAYRTDLFDKEMIGRMAGHYGCILRQIPGKLGASICSLNLLTEEERRQMVEGWNETWMKYPEGRTLHGLFGEQARRTPEAVAVLFRGQEIKYEELERRSNQLARYLRRQGVGVEARVGICVARSPEMVMAVLGVLKAGGAYVPLDPGYPEERLRYMVEDAETTVVLTEEGVRGRLGESRGRVICLEQEWEQIGRESEEGVEGGECESGNLAYVIYTSGSTGKPKGVGITHGSAVTLMYWGRDVVPERWLKGVLAATSICFDLSVFELFVPLSWGGRVVLVENVLELGEEGSQSWSGEVMLVNTVPSAMRELLQMKAVPKRVRGVLLAGEALLPGLVEQIYELEHVEQVWNLYGPSEDTTYSVYQRVERGSRRVAIGRPIANTRAYVLDGEMEAVPVGVGGELYLGGEGLGRGYLKRAGLTGERFVPDGISGGEGERLYRTGDRVRWLEDGRLEFLGRSDHQVKLRGFRIELAEIETVLESHAGLEQSAIVLREDKPGEQKLVAYVVRSQKMNLLDAVELKSHLRTKLPEYMLPAAFIELPELPLSPNGKVDRQALALMNGHGLPTQRDLKIDIRDCPRNTFELYVITIFEDVLGIKGLTSKHNFFELGGHSLSALMLADRLSQAFKKPISVRNVFEHPTIEAMAAFARQELAFSPPSCLIPIKPHGSLPPLFLVHPGGGRVMGYLPLGRTLSQDRPFYALQSYGLEEGQNVLFTIEDMAAAYIKEVRNVQPTGPYQIGGLCLGGTLAYEMAQQLCNAGETVSLLAILEDFAYSSPTRRPITEEELQQEKKIHLQKIMAQYFPPKFRISGSQLPHEFSLSYEEQLELILQKLKEVGQVPKDESCDRYRRAFHVTSVNIAAKRRYHLRPYAGRITLFRCKHSWHPDPTYGWGRLGASLDVHQFDWPHDDFISEKPQELAETLERCMGKNLFEMRASASVYGS